MTAICPRCHNRNIGDNDAYCWNCGLELGNFCDNPSCTSRESISERRVVELPDNFTFCPYCGSETYYARLGVVQTIEFEQDS